MKNTSKSLIKSFIPPIITELISSKKNTYGWFGNYLTWEEAKQYSTGYDSEEILSKVKNALLKVKNGEAVYERDSVVFDTAEYSWPLLASLMWIAAQNNGILNLIDFGGSLGSTYFQHKLFLEGLKKTNWSIVEQENFVQSGKQYFENDTLKFYEDIEVCVGEQNPNAILLSCVLPYVSTPYTLLEKIFTYNFTYIIFDRMPFIEGPQDRLTIQKVPPAIYEASYPAWFFSTNKFMNFIKKKYALVADFDCTDQANIKSEYKGLICKIKT